MTTGEIDYSVPPPCEHARKVWEQIVTDKLPLMLEDAEHHGQWGVVWHKPTLKSGQSAFNHLANLRDFAAMWDDERFEFKGGAHPRGGAAVWARVVVTS